MNRDEAARQLLIANGQDLAVRAMRLQTATQVYCYTPDLDYQEDALGDDEVIEADRKAVQRALRIADDLLRGCGLIR